jgi:hypothetical protein
MAPARRLTRALGGCSAAAAVTRLLGGPGADRLRDGAGGPAKAIYQTRKHGFRIRLRVEGNLISEVLS